MRIEHGEAGRPDGVAKISGIRDERVRDALCRGERRGDRHRARARLREPRGCSRGERQDEKRDLFEHDPARRMRRPLAVESPKWPEIDEEKEHRHRHQHRLRHQAQGARGQRGGEGRLSPAADPDNVGGDREKEKEGAQNILALGDPGHRFHVKRVNAEERRDERASPERAGHAPEQAEQKDRIEHVQEHVDAMRRARIHPEELHVHHVGEPGHRMPVRRVERGDCPSDTRGRQPRRDVRVRRHIFTVVEFDEAVSPRAPIHDKDEDGETERNEYREARGGAAVGR